MLERRLTQGLENVNVNPESQSSVGFCELLICSRTTFVARYQCQRPEQKKMSTLEQFVAFVHSWTFSPRYATKRVRRAPLLSHMGWQVALSSWKGIITKFMVDRPIIKFLCTRKLNQDHIENLHFMIRGMNGFDDHPTPHSYVSTLRCLSCKISTTELIQHPRRFIISSFLSSFIFDFSSLVVIIK
ncbi:hypothetical protein CAPTEDRAFT_207419, partial [Capitella teleta]